MKTIKKLAVLAVMAAVGTGISHAEFRFGIKAGMNVNKVKFNKEVLNSVLDEGNSCGWNAGVAAEFTVPLIGVGADVSLLYSRMNNNQSTIKLPTAVSTTDNNNQFGKNFLEIPVNVKYKLTLPMVSRIVKPMIYTGPSFALKLDKNISENIKSKTCQVAWNIGLGVELLNHLQVTASYGFGINNIADKLPVGINSADIKAKNNYWTVGLGYFF